MNIVLLVIIIILLIVCIILVSILINRNKNAKINPNSNYINNSVMPVQQIHLENIKIPKKIELLESLVLFQACKKVFDSFKALDYAKKLELELSKTEWHSWQVSLLISLIKSDRNFFIPETKNLFHRSITQCSENQIEEYMQKILYKYQHDVNINKTRDELSNELVWTSFEVSIIFYYMIHK